MTVVAVGGTAAASHHRTDPLYPDYLAWIEDNVNDEFGDHAADKAQAAIHADEDDVAHFLAWKAGHRPESLRRGTAAPAPVPRPVQPPPAPDPPAVTTAPRPSAGRVLYDDTTDLDPAELAFPAGTFLHDWMARAQDGYEPLAYHLWAGLVALGLALERSATWADGDMPVRGNLYVVMIGGTGIGKDNSFRTAREVVERALPTVEILPSEGSPEALIKSMKNDAETDEKTGVTRFGPGRTALLHESEWSKLAKAGNRGAGQAAAGTGPAWSEALIGFYDGRPVSNHTTGRGLNVAADHSLSIVANVQPARIHALFTTDQVTSGFLNRWVYVPGYTEKVRPSRAQPGAGPPLSDLVASLHAVHAWAKPGRLVDGADRNGAAAWDVFYRGRVMPDVKRLGEIGGRLVLLAKKLLLLFAANERTTSTTMEHVGLLAKMWPAITASYEALGGRAGRSVVEDAAETMLAEAERYSFKFPDGFTLAGLAKHSRAVRGMGKELRADALWLLSRAHDVYSKSGRYHLHKENS